MDPITSNVLVPVAAPVVNHSVKFILWVLLGIIGLIGLSVGVYLWRKKKNNQQS